LELASARALSARDAAPASSRAAASLLLMGIQAPRSYRFRLINPQIRLPMKRMRKMKNRIFAISTAPAAMPPKPKIAAMTAMMKKIPA
jgi:hypothetical protein